MTPLAQSPASAHSFYGLVTTVGEAHALLEGARQGIIPTISRRLSESERAVSVFPGAVFIFSETSGIKRWTDQFRWSPSRVQGSFLCYTQMPETGKSSLIKQSFSSTDAAGKLHLIAYYTQESLKSNQMPTVSSDYRVSHLVRSAQPKNTERRRSSMQNTATRPLTSTLSRSPPYARPQHSISTSYPIYSSQISPPMSSISTFKRHSMAELESLSPTSPSNSLFDSRSSMSSSSSTAPTTWPSSRQSPPASAYASLSHTPRSFAPNPIQLPPLGAAGVVRLLSPLPLPGDPHRRESWDQQQLDMFLPRRASG